ncbi:CBS domain-containing protein [Salipiger sp. PrR003]|uniref:CBS domain-containing protein n=1 Tax=Salipiger sp. PrR003 TaxID=2706776 RepID=UPI0013DB84A8|nr:CBS domain-containing protein [Salipiger sp. PrR003]NDV50076.1 CBS domain-containing protein [Salipiger sp. PrR003]
MQVNEVMTPHTVTLTPEQTLKDAAEIMQRIETGFVPIGQDERLVGTITDRDIVINGLAQGKSTDAAVGEVMSRDVLYVFDDQEVAEVARNMGESQVRRMPVVDRDKRLVGIVSLGDLSTDGDPSAAGVALEQISN